MLASWALLALTNCTWLGTTWIWRTTELVLVVFQCWSWQNILSRTCWVLGATKVPVNGVLLLRTPFFSYEARDGLGGGARFCSHCGIALYLCVCEHWDVRRGEGHSVPILSQIVHPLQPFSLEPTNPSGTKILRIQAPGLNFEICHLRQNFGILPPCVGMCAYRPVLFQQIFENHLNYCRATPAVARSMIFNLLFRGTYFFLCGGNHQWGGCITLWCGMTKSVENEFLLSERIVTFWIRQEDVFLVLCCAILIAKVRYPGSLGMKVMKEAALNCFMTSSIAAVVPLSNLVRCCVTQTSVHQVRSLL